MLNGAFLNAAERRYYVAISAALRLQQATHGTMKRSRRRLTITSGWHDAAQTGTYMFIIHHNLASLNKHIFHLLSDSISQTVHITRILLSCWPPDARLFARRVAWATKLMKIGLAEIRRRPAPSPNPPHPARATCKKRPEEKATLEKMDWSWLHGKFLLFTSFYSFLLFFHSHFCDNGALALRFLQEPQTALEGTATLPIWKEASTAFQQHSRVRKMYCNNL